MSGGGDLYESAEKRSGPAFEHYLEDKFYSIGKATASKPWVFIGCSVLLSMGLGSMMGKAEQETRPQEQWVAAGSPSLDHLAYVTENWPSQARFNAFIATCPGATLDDGAPDSCNMLTPEAMGVLQAKNDKVKALVIDGDAIAADVDDPSSAKYAGFWSFDGRAAADGQPTQRKCFSWGPACAEMTVLDVFGPGPCKMPEQPADPAAMTGAQVLAEFNAWDDMARPGGACSPFELGGLLGDVGRSGGQIAKAGMVMTWHQLSYDPTTINGVEEDHVAEEFEAEALCILGIEPRMFNKTHMTRQQEKCPRDPTLHFAGFYARSLGDSFGAAISGDLPKMGMAYVLMAVYLFVMLSRRDQVHSMINMSIAALVCVLFAYACGFGFAAILGVKAGVLNNTVLFLLLGLGVDDAFVLSSEFTRETRENPHLSIEERSARCAKSGGVSVLITSLTDCLAFLIGSTTKLPALSWFCQYCGWSIFFCFMMQLTVLLPCLALNARRAENGEVGPCCRGAGEGKTRADFFCCLKVAARPMTGPLTGCCGLCCKPGSACGKQDILEGLFGRFAGVLLSPMGRKISFLTFSVLSIVGIVGAVSIKKDFQLVWFVPEDAPAYEYLKWSGDFYKTGEKFMLYTKQFDYHAEQDTLTALNGFLTTSPLIDQQEGVQDWHTAFQAAVAGSALPSAAWHAALHDWLWTAGQSFQSNVQWADHECNTHAPADCASCACDAIYGSRIGATLHVDGLADGGESYETMVELRAGIKDIMGNLPAFPYSSSFLYWEEMGLIDTELIQNLLVCSLVILVIIFCLIPRPPIASMTTLTVLLAIVDVVGYCHWMGMTVSGVTTIYLLIGVGLAVDYSAHIAHFFKDAQGTAHERAAEALTRIGPCVFHAVVTLFLAVIALSTSASFVFRTLFKVFTLTVIFGGSYGLCLLPVLLATFGGDAVRTEPEKPKSPKVAPTIAGAIA